MATEDKSGVNPKKKRAPSKPRPLFVVYKATVDAEGNADVDIITATRNAADVLGIVDGDRDLKFKRITV